MPSLRLVGVVGLAWTGVVLGHLVGYAGHRLGAPLVPAGGHGSFSVAFVAGIAILPAVLTLLSVRALRVWRGSGVLRLIAGMVGIQLPIFVVMELVERGMALDPTLLDPTFTIGIVIQMLVVLVSTVLVGVLVRVLRSIVGRPLRTDGARARQRSRPPVGPDLSHFVFLIAVRRRAPPFCLVSR
ncbi:MAG: hypothetical protein ACRDQ2_08125 [Gaiellales bacterium]